MKFDEKYLDEDADSKYLPDVIKQEHDMPCFSCGDGTRWQSKKFRAPVCSDECLEDAMDDLTNYFNTEKEFDPVKDFLLS